MLRATDIVLKFKRRDGSSITALNHVSVEIPDHSRVGLVGESGSGKSTLARVLCGLVKPASGTVEFDGPTPWSRQLIFQDSIGALNPRRSVGSTLREVLRIHGIGGVTAESLLERVGLPPELESRRPSELSGGQCQRICIARALALSPTVIIGDEPVSALDVSVQARILRLLSEVTGSGSGDSPALLMITHDLSVVSAVCDYVYVMEKGRIVEQGPVDTVFSSPRHPYTARLLASVPRIAQEAC